MSDEGSRFSYSPPRRSSPFYNPRLFLQARGEAIRAAGDEQMFLGMDQASTGEEQPAESDTQEPSLELPTEPLGVALEFSCDIGDGRSPFRLLIEAPTFEVAFSIFREGLARYYTIASRVVSGGGSHD
jgi:hypothetical protein